MPFILCAVSRRNIKEKSYNKIIEVKDTLLFFHVLHNETGFNKSESEKYYVKTLWRFIGTQKR